MHDCSASYVLHTTQHFLLQKPRLFVWHSSSQNQTVPSTGLSRTQVRWNCSVEVSSNPISITTTYLPVNCTPLPCNSLDHQTYEGPHSEWHCTPRLQGPH